jgi:ABC-type transport system involved in multi-copper enzyme maturation permease subunit
VRPLALAPGDYMVPRPSSSAEMKSPEFIEKVKQGPVLVLTVMRNEMTPMGRNLGLWFIYIVVVSFISAYVASRAVGVGPEYLAVFRFVGVTAFCCYALALWQLSIWYARAWSMTIKSSIDGLVYALLTAGTFGWLWPG